MPDPLTRRVPVAIVSALCCLTPSASQAQTASSLVSVHGHMETSSNIIDKFVFSVPASTTNLTIRVPLPPSSSIPAAGATLSEGETIASVTVVENKQPDSQTDERDPSGNLYRVLKYGHVDPGIITVSAVMRDVHMDTDLNAQLPDATLPLQWMPPSIHRYLAPTKLVQSGDERIALLARRITGNCRSESDAAQAISLWLQERIGYSMNGATENRTDAVSTMDSGEGICEGWAHLFLALARASGIPCRYVAGYSIGGDISYPLSASGHAKVTVLTPSLPHAWVEVWYPGAGWAPYDPQSSAGFVDTHHVPLWTGLDGNSNLPILTWQSSPADAPDCSFAEQESASNISDEIDLFCDQDADTSGSSANFVFSR